MVDSFYARTGYRSFEEFYHAHNDKFRGIFFKLTGDSVSTKDFTQEAFTKMLESLDSFNPADGLKPKVSFERWAYGIVRHIKLDYFRRIKRRGEFLKPDLSDMLEDDVTPEDHIIAEKAAQKISYSIVHGLKGRPKEVFQLSFLGYKPREIAKLLGISSEAVRTSLYRARKQLLSEND